MLDLCFTKIGDQLLIVTIVYDLLPGEMQNTELEPTSRRRYAIFKI